MTGPERTCIGCRLKARKPELVRLVWDGQTGVVVVDTAQVRAGRGCYLHPGCGPAAAKRRAVGRALRRPVDAAQAEALLADLAPSGTA